MMHCKPCGPLDMMLGQDDICDTEEGGTKQMENQYTRVVITNMYNKYVWDYFQIISGF